MVPGGASEIFVFIESENPLSMSQKVYNIRDGIVKFYFHRFPIK